MTKHTHLLATLGFGAAAIGLDVSRMLSGHPQEAPDPGAPRRGHDMGVIGATTTRHPPTVGAIPPARIQTWNEVMLPAMNAPERAAVAARQAAARG